MVGRSSPEAPEPAGLLYAADVSDSPHLDEALSWVTTEEVQSTDPLAGQFDHAAWIDETAIATVGTVAAGTIAADIGDHPLVEDTKYDDLEVLYVRAPGLMHTDVQLLTAAALASRVPVSVPPLPAAAPADEAQQPNPLFVVGALGLVALIIAAFTAGGWWTSRTGEDEPIAFGDVGTDTVPTQGPIGAIAAPTTTVAAPSTTEPAPTTTEPPATTAAPTTTVAAAAPVDQEAVLASATEALRNAGYSGMSVRYEGDLLVLEGVMPAAGLNAGYFSQVEEITSVISGLDGVQQVSTRLFLRGDDARLRSQLRALSESTPVEFPFASADLTPESRNALQAVADAILANPGLRVLVAGHTDATGSPEANAQLGGARAGAVIQELIRLGVPITRLQPVAYGELFPDAAGTDAENRRVEFEVAP
jgi:outer membrane protein OmpA-like peptidoglycan-associated protein